MISISVPQANWTEKVHNILITGGSRGVGLDIARAVVKQGNRAIIVARRQTIEWKDLASANPGKADFENFDLENIEEIDSFVKAVRRKHGAISALVNNAAMGIDGVITTLKPNQIANTIKLNLTSPIFLTRAVAKTMMADGGGKIINVSSVNAFTGYNGLSVYAATKAGMIGFTKSLARELGRANIMVNAVAPGLMETRMVSGMSEERRDTIRRRSPLNRFATTVEVANAVMFLLSDASSGMTGTVMTIDAGNTA
jgi:3-oxoacyl-[acyl-carrier protein] reductase